MKLKAIALATVASISVGSAATMGIGNLVNATDDTLYADTGGNLLTAGIVTIGYFPDGVTPSNLAELNAALGDFTVVTSGAAGNAEALGGAAPGFAQINAVDTSLGQLTGANPLLGRPVYSIVGDAASLGASGAFAMVQVGTLSDDVPFEQTYGSNPAGLTPIVGSTGSFMGDLGWGGGQSTYPTIQLEIPEPGAIALGLIGFLGLLRRRR